MSKKSTVEYLEVEKVDCRILESRKSRLSNYFCVVTPLEKIKRSSASERKQDSKSSSETNKGDEGDKENKKDAENEELVKEKEQKSAGDKNEKNENEKVKCTLCNQFFFKKGIKAHVTRKHGNM